MHFCILPSFAIADEVNYLYDDTGRVVSVLKGTERLLYQYDEVGNLLSISTESSTPGTSPPVLQGISPDIFLTGLSYNVLITGQNLLTTKSITTDNPDITIKNITAIDTRIQAIISIASSAAPGQATLTVTTSYGSANMVINIYGANIVPDAISLFPASTASLKVSLNPPAAKDFKASINNKNPEIINTQSFLIIPAGGIADLTIKALKEGTGTIQIGSEETTVFVIGGGSLIEALPVCVSLEETVPDNTAIYASPVSVFISDIYIGLVLSHSNPVSVATWLVVPGAITVSAQVCVKIEN